MAVFHGPTVNTEYRDSVLRALQDGGTISKVPSSAFKNDLEAILALNPSLVTIPYATKAGKLYSIVPDTGAGDFDVTRSSTATYLGSDGLLKTAANNEPRIEFNADGSYKGLLVEPAATNLVLRSESLTLSTVRVGYTATSNVATSPDGNVTADLLLESTSTLQLIQKEFSVGSTTDSYRCSFFVKANGRTTGRISYGLNGAPFSAVSATFNLTDGTITAATGSTGATAGTSKIESYGNGWYRVSLNGVIGTAGTHYVRLQDNNGGAAGDPTKGFYLWGLQAELGSVATSYIPTVASTVTRAADVITRTGASALIGQTEGTIYAEGNIRNLGGVRPVLAISDGSNNNRILINSFVQSGNTNLGIAANLASGSTVTLNNPTTTLGTFKVAVAYSGTEMVIYVNGVATSPATTMGFGNFSIIGIGQNTTNSVQLNDHIKAAALLPTRLSNAQLEALTTL
jgi:hypothetical protein